MERFAHSFFVYQRYHGLVLCSAGAGGRTTVRAASLVVGDVVFCFDGPKQLDAIDDLEGDFEVQAGRLS